MTLVHIIPSGRGLTLCGKAVSDVEGTSIGMFCTCKKCYTIARKINKGERND